MQATTTPDNARNYPRRYTRRVARPPRTPQLRLHATGVYFCRWGGRDHYFTKNLSESEPLYRACLSDWSRWSAAKATRPTAPTSNLRFAELVELFQAAKFPEVSRDTQRWYRGSLRRAINIWGRFPANVITQKHLQALLQDLRAMELEPKTIRHDLNAIKAVLRWGMQLEHIPPVALDAVKPPRASRLKEKWRTREQVVDMIGKARKADEQLAAWMSLQYLAALRPSELPRLSRREGEWVSRHVYAIEGKMTWKTGEPRHVILSEEALIYFNTLQPKWETWEAYASLVSETCGPGGAHPLRHSAATHLRRAGVARETVDLILGHLPSRVSRTYAPEWFDALVQSAATLTLR